MNTGIFFAPDCSSILVVYNYAIWIPQVFRMGFSQVPDLERPATQEETKLALSIAGVPFWKYTSLPKLIDDEVAMGVSADFLDKLHRRVEPLQFKYPS